jgi:WD40 repeat protein
MKVNARTSEILIHWRALEDGNVRRISRIQINVDTFNSGTGVGNRAIDEIWDVSPLAMASSTFDTVCFGPVLSIAARGQNLAHFCLWTNPKESNGSSVPNTNADKTSHHALVSDVAEASNDPDKLPPIFQPRLTFHSDSLSFDYRAYRLRRTHERKSNHFVFLKYFQNTRLVVGTSKGDLLKVGMYRDTNAKPPNRSVLYGCCKGGMVEAVELVGNKNPIMITAGGYDGRIRFWDWDTFDSLGSLRIHPGQQTFFAEAALASRTAAMPIAHHRFSPVVSTFFCHERSSLVSFCRDGHIHEWKVHEEAKKLNAMKNDEGSVKAETDTTDLNRDESLRNCHHHNTRRTRRRSRPLS